MRIFYWQAPRGNFGDDMNQWFWDDLMPGWRQSDLPATLIGVGSLLTTNLDLPAGRKIIVGAGAGYGTPPTLSPADDWDVRFVRGPKTAQVLGLDRSFGLTDPAALVPRLPRFAGRQPRGRRPLFVPHCYSDVHPDFDWAAIASMAGVDYLSPRGNAVNVIRTISAAPLVLAESLHAAIVADAFRVPWRPVSTNVTPLKLFKWQDWCESLDLVMPEPVHLLGPLQRLRSLLRRDRPDPRPGPLDRQAATSPANRHGGGAPPETPPLRTRETFRLLVRDRVRAAVAARSLARAARLEPLLSRDAVLADRLDRGTEAMRDLARDYGVTSTL